jgi:SAM-dependent methyltransferase
MSARVLSLTLALALGCAGVTPTSPEVVLTPPSSEAPTETSEAPTESEASDTPSDELVSVRPKVNDRYFEPDAIDTWTARLERERREVIAHREAIVAALELEPGMVVADIGAGTGAFMASLSEAVGEQGRVYAVDIVPAFLDHLRERAAADALTNVEVVEGSPTALPVPDDSVDLLFLCDVYHHIEYPAVYLRSLHRALRADGRMIVVEFDKVPGKTSPAMMEHVRQDKPTLLAELAAEGFVLEREITAIPLDENYMLVFRKGEPPAPEPVAESPPDPAASTAPVVAVAAPVLVHEVDPAHYRMVLAGDIIIGLGGAALVAMGVGLGVRSDAVNQRRAWSVAVNPDADAIARQDRRIHTGTLVAISGGAAAGVLLATGITMVALGYARERKRREALRLVFAPQISREHEAVNVGLGALLRF